MRTVAEAGSVALITPLQGWRTENGVTFLTQAVEAVKKLKKFFTSVFTMIYSLRCPREVR
jgi:hypothetical protein